MREILKGEAEGKRKEDCSTNPFNPHPPHIPPSPVSQYPLPTPSSLRSSTFPLLTLLLSSPFLPFPPFFPPPFFLILIHAASHCYSFPVLLCPFSSYALKSPCSHPCVLSSPCPPPCVLSSPCPPLPVLLPLTFGGSFHI